MDTTEFVKNFAEQFDETDASEFSMNTIFRNLDEWCSLIALSIIAMVDESYKVKLTGDDIRNSKTIEDIYNIVNSKI
jgi:acyl carrier protein